MNCLRPAQRGEEGAPSQSDRGDEGPSVAFSIRWPLSYPIAPQWAPFLSPLARGEDVEQG